MGIWKCPKSHREPLNLAEGAGLLPCLLWKWLGLWFLSEAGAQGRSSVIEDNYEVSHPVGADGRAWLLPL